MSSITTEEHPVLRVGYIIVNLQWVGMVRKIPHSERKPHRVMCADVDIFGASYVCCEVARIAWLVSGLNVILEDVHRLPGKSVAILNVR